MKMNYFQLLSGKLNKLVDGVPSSQHVGFAFLPSPLHSPLKAMTHACACII
jgi:hypothetical protein